MHEHLNNPLGFSQEENNLRPVHLPGAAGIDEAGRGCLAGPVVAAAVFLPDFSGSFSGFSGLTDSKQLSETERLQFEKTVKANSLAWSLGFVWPGEIDRTNILRATFEAMSLAFASMLAKVEGKAAAVPEILLIDGNQAIPPGVLLNALWKWKLGEGDILPQQTVIKGDSRVLAIAAASVLAKTARDRLMLHLDRKYPGFGFGQHKGYGTKFHLEAIKRLGVTPMHRCSFRGCRPEDLGGLSERTGQKEYAEQSLLLPS